MISVRSLLTTLILFCLSSLAGAATVDIQPLKSIPLGSTPQDVVATADGKRIYVLTSASQVEVYTTAGQLIGAIPVDKTIDGIIPQGPDRLLLKSSSTSSLTLAHLEISEDIEVGSASTLGPVDAPVTIVVFDDFECPYCAKAVPLLKKAQQAHPEMSRLVYKNFPLKMHRNAELAAIAGLAAERQDKFWPLHDLLFEHFNKLNPQKINALALQAGLDMPRFKQDLKDPALKRQVQDDIRQGRDVGVRGTPTIFVNGRRLNERSFAELDRMIKEELNRINR